MRSDLVKKGSTRAAHRSLFYALGFSDEDLKKPLIAVVNSQTDIIAGHAHLDDQAKMVKYGILAAGGVPIEVPAIGLCDGIAMGHEGMKYPLASRELIADSIEAQINGHAFDGMVLIPNCDKIVSLLYSAAAAPCSPAVTKEKTFPFPPRLKQPAVLKPAKLIKQNCPALSVAPAPAAAAAPVCSPQIP